MPKENIEFQRFKATPKILAVGKPFVEPRSTVAIDNTYVHKPLKSLVTTGLEELELAKNLPKLEGEIIFCHGYLSSPLHNEEGTLWNAPMKQDPDNPGFFTKRGENADEYNHANPDDIYTSDELNEDFPVENRKNDQSIRAAFKNAGFMKFSNANKYWGYWNSLSNKFEATETYAKYFNATGNEHYINGSHGMGSAGSHRVDHGISLGYSWAASNWGIIKKEDFDSLKDIVPAIESSTPAYKPVTVVGHSQGCACAAGVVCGILNYAAEMGWDKIPVNIIFLGVHQNTGFTKADYEEVMRQKKDKYEIDNADVWNGYFSSFFKKGADNVGKLFNGLSWVFDVSNHEKGIYEQLKEITTGWEDIKGRSIQFTFTNDRADVVFRDGDIPEIDCAANPNINSHFMCTQFFKTGDAVEPGYNEYESITITPQESGGYGGTLTIPGYHINQRLKYKDITDLKKKESWKDNLIPAEWTQYRTLAIEWACAYDLFLLKKAEFKIVEDNYLRARGRSGPGYQNSDFYHSKGQLRTARKDMVYKYGRIHDADLYAHFSPVGLINDVYALKDWGGKITPNDSVGINENIWERLKKIGGGKFYKPNYGDDDINSLSENKKREAERTYVDGKGKQLLVSTDIATTDYINKIIDEHIKNPDHKNIWERFKEWRYKKSWLIPF